MGRKQPKQLQKEIADAKEKLNNTQMELNRDSRNQRLVEREKRVMGEFKKLCEREVLEMQQRVEEEWTIFRDKCSKVFHKLLKAKKNKLAICEVEDMQGLFSKGG